jgi:pyruvate dehydrogenase E2 component (dihydrolipoamide acetyltransferase)
MHHADRVSGLVSISGLGFGGEVSSEFMERFISAERRKDVKAAAAMLFADPSLASDEMVDQLLAFKRTDGVQQALETLAQRSLAAGAASELAKTLQNLNIPVLALHGAKDHVIPPPGALPGNIRSEIIPEAGHMPHMEASSQVNAKIAQFLRENS